MTLSDERRAGERARDGRSRFFQALSAKDMVVVHQVDIDKNGHASVSQTSYMAMLSMIADANCDDKCK